MRVAVLGAGNGGLGVAADLARRGHEVRLFELERFSKQIESVAEQGGIRYEGIFGTGLARLARITTDAGVALEGAELVIVAVPAYGHRPMAEQCAPFLTPAQPVVLCPGYVGGALEFRAALAEHGCHNARVAETAAFPFICRRLGEGAVLIRGIKEGVLVAALPAGETPLFTGLLGALWPGAFQAAENVLATSLNEFNMTLHPPLVVCNLGLFDEGRGPFTLFQAGMTPGVGRLAEALDAERMGIIRRLGVHGLTAREWLLHFYQGQGLAGADIYSLLKGSAVHQGALSPTTLEHRYVHEDVSYGLVPLADLAGLLGVPAPVSQGMVAVASAITGQDLRSQGRTLARLGLEGATVTDLLGLVG